MKSFGSWLRLLVKVTSEYREVNQPVIEAEIGNLFSYSKDWAHSLYNRSIEAEWPEYAAEKLLEYFSQRRNYGHCLSSEAALDFLMAWGYHLTEAKEVLKSFDFSDAVQPRPHHVLPPSDYPFHIFRDCERPALEAIKDTGRTIIIKGPKDLGKTEMLGVLADSAKQGGKLVVSINLQQLPLDEGAIPFFRAFCSEIADELSGIMSGEQVAIPNFNDDLHTPSRTLTRYLTRQILPKSGTLVLLMDNVDLLFVENLPYRKSFFDMLRAWHDLRKTSPKSPIAMLDTVVSISMDPYLERAEPGSPFNVGDAIVELDDLTPGECGELNRKMGSPMPESHMDILYNIVGGHPYMTADAIKNYNNIDFNNLMEIRLNEDGPFGLHLRRLKYRLSLYSYPELEEFFLSVVHGQDCSDVEAEFRLRGAGLVKRDENNRIVPRYPLYADFFLNIKNKSSLH